VSPELYKRVYDARELCTVEEVKSGYFYITIIYGPVEQPGKPVQGGQRRQQTRYIYTDTGPATPNKEPEW
jgi:hypothetical protein